MRISFFALIVFLIPALSIANDVYYVDPDAPDGGNGSYANPWNSAQQINTKKFHLGDQIYFKVGTTLALQPGNHDSVKPKLSGTATKQAIIGAYHGNGEFGLRPSDKRPTILGTGWVNLGEGLNVPEDVYDSLVDPKPDGGYLTIRDLHVRNSYSGGINISPPPKTDPVSGLKVLNNVIEYCGRNGLSVARAHGTLIEDNHIDGTAIRKATMPSGNTARTGGSINVVGGNSLNGCNHSIVRNNTITRTGAALIAVIKGAQYTIVENNTLYDSPGLFVYLDVAPHSIVRNNLFFQPVYSKSRRKDLLKDQPSTGVRVENEWSPERRPKWTGYITIQDNYFAGLTQGINLNNQAHDRFGVEPNRHNVIFNNRLVDCGQNFLFRHISDKWHDNYIYGNYSFIYTSGHKHTSTMSPSGVIWGVSATRNENGELKSTGQIAPNYFNTVIATVTGNAASNAAFNQFNLKKTTGWRDLGPEVLTRASFEFTGETKSPTGALGKVQSIKIVPITTKE